MRSFRCPKCHDAQLHFVGTRGVAQCSQCGGMFVPRGKTPEAAADDPAPQVAPEGHDSKGGRCPHDGTILSRAEITLADGRSIHLERCVSCKGIWFDAGEWNAVATEHLVDHIDDAWTPEFRTEQRRAREQRAYDDRQREELGPLYDQLTEMAEKLKGHPRRSQALAFIRERSSE